MCSMYVNSSTMFISDTYFLHLLNLEFFLSTTVVFIVCRTLVLQNDSSLGYPLLSENTRMTFLLVSVLSLCIVIQNNFIYCDWNFFEGAFVNDGLTNLIRFLIFITICCYFLIGSTAFQDQKSYLNEFFTLVFVSLIGLTILIGTKNFLYLFLALELQSLSFYVLAALKKRSDFSIEASVKYYVLGAIASSFLLFGISLIYGFSGTLNFVELRGILELLANESENFRETQIGLSTGFLLAFVALLFKIGLAPFHFWVADVYEGSPSSTTAFFSLIPKVCLVGVLVRLLIETFSCYTVFWQPVLITCSIFSILIGTFGALNQKRIKRLLAYSAIGHSGYLTITVGAAKFFSMSAFLIYGLLYILTTLNIFVVILAHRLRFNSTENPTLLEIAGVLRTNSLLGLGFALPFFSLAGIPPLLGFMAKVEIFSVFLESNFYISCFFLMLISVISCFYYIRFMKLSFFDSSLFLWELPINRSAAYILGFCLNSIFFFTFTPAFFTNLVLTV